MKNVCEECRYAKFKKDSMYCVKYGHRTVQKRIYCVAFERDYEQVSESKDRA